MFIGKMSVTGVFLLETVLRLNLFHYVRTKKRQNVCGSQVMKQSDYSIS